jgi:hypothetical protein
MVLNLQKTLVLCQRQGKARLGSSILKAELVHRREESAVKFLPGLPSNAAFVGYY